MEIRTDAEFLRRSETDHVTAFKFRKDTGSCIIEGQEINAVTNYIAVLENQISMLAENQKAMLSYPASIELDTNGEYRVWFPDVPEANATGDTEDEALMNAVDALESALEIYVDGEHPFPKPSELGDDQHLITLDASFHPEKR